MEFLNIWSSIILGSFALIITLVYSHKSKNIQNDQMVKELFEKFNERYDKINDSLQKVIEAELKNNIININQLSELKIEGHNKSYKQVLIDYFNLCAEEYFWHRKGRIDNEIWKSWKAGMTYWYNKSPLMRNFWQAEKQDNGYVSYYLVNNETDFFNSK